MRPMYSGFQCTGYWASSSVPCTAAQSCLPGLFVNICREVMGVEEVLGFHPTHRKEGEVWGGRERSGKGGEVCGGRERSGEAGGGLEREGEVCGR